MLYHNSLYRNFSRKLFINDLKDLLPERQTHTIDDRQTKTMTSRQTNLQKTDIKAVLDEGPQMGDNQTDRENEHIRAIGLIIFHQL